MRNQLKAKTTINCETCGCSLKRVKTFKVTAINEADAKAEAMQKVAAWKSSLQGKSCRVCQTILNDVAA